MVLAMDVIASVLLSEVANRLIEGLLRITRSSKNEMEKLILSHDYVMKMVQGKDRAEVNDVIWKWVEDVDKLWQQIIRMQNEVETKHGLTRVYYSVRRFFKYQKLIPSKIRALNTKLELIPLFVPAPPIPAVRPVSSGNFEYFQSTTEAAGKLMEALGDDTCHIIGLCGLRGSGKTALVKAVVGEQGNHYLIVFATVSIDPNIRRIQDEIADCLGFKLEESSEAGRSRRILSRLFSHKHVLVIFDDVLAKLEFEDVGIPYKGDHRGLKVLFTTRNQQVCTLMECDKEVALNPLSENDAWKLFRKHSGIDEENNESSSSLLNVAREVAIECKGLPGKIKDVGYSLKRKPIEEWEATLDSLRHSMALYQVFLSFRGDDTRYSFTGFLYDALCREGFKTFMDDGGLERGDQISEALVKAIEASRLSIIVFSENFAYSSWCLDELVTILECKRTKNQLVWPIFYKVEPSDVRHQKNNYGKAMDAHASRLGKDSERLQKWKSALSEVAGLSGDHYKTGYEHRFIQMIVEKANNIKNRLYIQSIDMD